MMPARPLIAHIIYHLGTGGMENGLVNLINHMPRERYRHTIICLKGYDDFRRRLPDDVEVIALGKREGNDFASHRRLYRHLKTLAPDILHTRNLATLETQIIGALAGIKARVHGEHGRDIYDLEGRNRKYLLLRQAMRAFVPHYMAVSADLADWLVAAVHVAPKRVTHIYNGVDSARFTPHHGPRPALLPAGFASDNSVVIGSVGRLAEVKGYEYLARAFVELLQQAPQLAVTARLVLVGDGSQRQACERIVEQAGFSDFVWFAGERSDIPQLMQTFDVFVLPSLGEGISNTILEAMATALPIVATAVGGNPELVGAENGTLVKPADPQALADALQPYAEDPGMRRDQGRASRALVEKQFSMHAMVQGYLDTYANVTNMTTRKPGTAAKLARAK